MVAMSVPIVSCWSPCEATWHNPPEDSILSVPATHPAQMEPTCAMRMDMTHPTLVPIAKMPAER